MVSAPCARGNGGKDFGWQFGALLARPKILRPMWLWQPHPSHNSTCVPSGLALPLPFQKGSLLNGPSMRPMGQNSKTRLKNLEKFEVKGTTAASGPSPRKRRIAAFASGYCQRFLTPNSVRQPCLVWKKTCLARSWCASIPVMVGGSSILLRSKSHSCSWHGSCWLQDWQLSPPAPGLWSGHWKVSCLSNHTCVSLTRWSLMVARQWSCEGSVELISWVFLWLHSAMLLAGQQLKSERITLWSWSSEAFYRCTMTPCYLQAARSEILKLWALHRAALVSKIACPQTECSCNSQCPCKTKWQDQFFGGFKPNNLTVHWAIVRFHVLFVTVWSQFGRWLPGPSGLF